MAGQTILLGGTDIDIAETLIIDATALTANVTIDANLQSRIFDVTANLGAITLAGLKLTRGKTTADGDHGGAVRSASFDMLTLSQSTISDSSTTGDGSDGGAIWAFSRVTLDRSIVSGNSTTGASSDGGAIWSNGYLTISQSTVSGNSTTGYFSSRRGSYFR